MDISKPASVLMVPIDLVDESTAANRKRDFQEIAKREHLYDLEVLKIAFQHLRRQREQTDAQGEVLTLSPMMLRTADVVNRDIVDQDNQLLLTAGTESPEVTIRCLRDEQCQSIAA